MLFRSRRAEPLPPDRAILVALAPILAYAALWQILGPAARAMFRAEPWPREILDLVYFTAIGALVVVHLEAVPSLPAGWHAALARLEKPIRWAAGASFTLYLAHQPLLVMARALLPDLPSRPLLGLAVMGAMLVAVAGLAEIGRSEEPHV